jgi:hypothetical protein
MEDASDLLALACGRSSPELRRARGNLLQQRLDAAPIDYSDIPPLDDEFFEKATRLKSNKNGEEI